MRSVQYLQQSTLKKSYFPAEFRINHIDSASRVVNSIIKRHKKKLRAPCHANSAWRTFHVKRRMSVICEAVRTQHDRTDAWNNNNNNSNSAIERLERVIFMRSWAWAGTCLAGDVINTSSITCASHQLYFHHVDRCLYWYLRRLQQLAGLGCGLRSLSLAHSIVFITIHRRIHCTIRLIPRTGSQLCPTSCHPSEITQFVSVI